MMVPVRLILQVGGTVLGVASTIVSGIAGQKAMEAEVAKRVTEEVTKQLSRSN